MSLSNCAGVPHEPRPQIVEIDHFLVRQFAYEEAAIGPGLQQAGLGERAAGFAHRTAADAETRRQRQLVDARAALELALENQALDLGVANADQGLGTAEFDSVLRGGKRGGRIALVEWRDAHAMYVR